ncbi:MAG: 16S rRNA (cytosine(1402)-N(4))-methyltransferase RsmH [Candidatus Aminicenantes bacterium]|nr:16S rRNA (cytosine(1402)-N(4))-methyltransferase RsmH [Candidatus Aminicenantes bacterium]
MIGRDHIPVLLEEALNLLDAARPGLYVDGTLGLAGHSREILKRNSKARLVGFDKDEAALAEAQRRLSPYENRIELYQADFRRILEVDIDWPGVRGVLLDLGMSSFQLDDPLRGFSHSLDGPLDMRMDRRQHLDAARILDKYPEPKLAEIFRNYGELRPAAKLARAIASRRRMTKIESTVQLREIVEDVCRWIPQKGKIHPAAKVFQALRIEVNEELAGLGDFLDAVIDRLPADGRLAVISFHSLEDRVVKHTFARAARPEQNGGRGAAVIDLLTKHPVIPTDEEISRNSRSRSAKLRAVRKHSHGT